MQMCILQFAFVYTSLQSDLDLCCQNHWVMYTLCRAMDIMLFTVISNTLAWKLREFSKTCLAVSEETFKYNDRGEKSY